MNYFFLYDSTTGAITESHMTTATEWTNIPQGIGVIGPFDQNTASQLVQDAYNNSARYLVQNGELVLQPYFTLSLAGNVVTVTLNNPPTTPPAQVSFTIAGTAFSIALTNGSASLTVNLHKVVASQAIAVAASASGCVGASLNIGGTSAPSTHLKATAQSDGSVLVKCTSKSEITAYYMAHDVPQSSILTDLANWVDLLTSMTLKLASTAPAGTFTAAEQTAISDMNTNLLPKLRLTLADATETSTNPRYASIVSDKAAANTNADEYLSVIADPDVH